MKKLNIPCPGSSGTLPDTSRVTSPDFDSVDHQLGWGGECIAEGHPESRDREGRRAQVSQLPLEALRGLAASLLPGAGHQVRAMLEAQGRPKSGWRKPTLISRLAPVSQ